MRTSFLILISSLFFSLPVSAAAEDTAPAPQTDKRALIGEVTFEDSSPVRNTYAETQDSVIEHFKKLSELTPQLAQGATGEVPPLSDNAIAYLNAVYLYCAVNYGECPLVLDAVLEGDIINSKISRQVQCPSMTRFWKSWVRTDMEARHKYMVKTAFLKQTSDFNQNKRVAYIKCQDTVSKQIAGNETDAAFFKERYRADSAHALTAAKMAKLLEDLKIKVPNIFGAVGTSFGSVEKPKGSVGQVKVRR